MFLDGIAQRIIGKSIRVGVAGQPCQHQRSIRIRGEPVPHTQRSVVDPAALTGGSTSNVQNYSIVINLRLPRILMAIIVGAGLSCAGNTYQSLFSNPLATPDIFGVTSGTCVGAILAIILSCSILETQLIALVFGLISVCFTLKIAGKSDGRSMVYLVLAGTIASSLFNAQVPLVTPKISGVASGLENKD